MISPGDLTLHTLTAFLMASKYDELDDNIPLIKELQRFFGRIIPPNQPLPTFQEVVECERTMIKFFGWDLMIVLPIHVLMSLFANGIVFENES